MTRIKLIGKDINYVGKTVWEIVGNLKDYGVNRLITRSMYERYPEPSYFKIVKVIPQQDLLEPSYDKYRKVIVWVEKVFRGNKLPKVIELFSATYKHDYRLIPKEDEHIWLKRAQELKHQIKYVKPVSELPPLLKLILISENEKRGLKVPENEMKLQLKINQKLNNRVKVSDDVNAVPFEHGYGTPISPSLFENIEFLREYYMRGLIRQGLVEIPSIMAANFCLVVAVGYAIYHFYDVYKYGDTRIYRIKYTVYRPDDPRAEKYRQFYEQIAKRDEKK